MRACTGGWLWRWGLFTRCSAESLFAWFRRYAGVFNSLDPLRHKFLLLFYVMLHMLDWVGTERLESEYDHWRRLPRFGTR